MARVPAGQQSAAFCTMPTVTVGLLLAATIPGGLGAAAVCDRTAAVDRLDSAATR
jgi:hypothetical protein